MSAEPVDLSALSALLGTGSARTRKRLLMGVGAVLPLAEAAGLLPMPDGEARAWLRRKGLVRDLDGREVVRWLDVLDALGPVDVEPSRPVVPRGTPGRVHL